MESKLINGDCLEELKELDDNTIDLICSDPPYGLSFMGKKWDSFNEVISFEGESHVYAKKGFKKLPRNKPIAMEEFFVPIWKECLRVLKPGGFAFIMAAPKQDVLQKQIEAMDVAGFKTNFTSIYWTYATGFPKAMNIGKAVDKRLGKERKVIGKKKGTYADIRRDENTGQDGWSGETVSNRPRVESYITEPKSDEAKKLDGSYAGYQPKPAVEVVIVAMKPLEQKGYLDQALDNGKGVTWLDDARIPFAGMSDTEQYDKDNVGSQKNFDTEAEGLSRGNQPSRKSKSDYEKYVEKQKSFKGAKTIGNVKEGGTSFLGGDMKQLDTSTNYQRKTTKRKPREENTVFKTSGFKSENNDIAEASPLGRFAANLLVSDDVLNDGNITKTSNDPDRWKGYKMLPEKDGWNKNDMVTNRKVVSGDEGSFSRYYSLDAWWEDRVKKLPEGVQRTFPFLIVPKASKSEKNMGLENFEKKKKLHSSGDNHVMNEICPTHKITLCPCGWRSPPVANFHPTVKPMTLMSYLVTLGSRKGDIVLDPFMGSGTTPISCVISERNYIGIEREEEYFKIAEARVEKALNPANLVKHEFF